MEPRDLLAILSAGVMKRHGDHHHGSEDEETEAQKEQHQDSRRNHALAEVVWYTVILLVVIGLILRLVKYCVARIRLQRRDAASSSAAQDSLLERVLDRLSASYWRRQLPAWIPASLPVGKILAVLAYAGLVTTLLTWKSIKHDDRYLERLGFRAAWITTTQTALPFLLAARTNPIGIVVGTSYNHLNWLHRWASRVFLATATAHGSFFLAEWLPADFLWEELRTVAMVKWGMAAWLVLVWTLVSSLIPVRRWRYEFFVAQHILSAVVLLVFLLLHVPGHHLFSVWCAVAVFLYDVVTRAANPVWRNVKFGRLPATDAGLSRVPRYAYSAKVEAVDEDLTSIRIRGIGFKWTPGQHVLIWTPSMKRQSPHPFTIANVADPTKSTQDIHLLAKTKTGFTKNLNEWASGLGGSMRESELRLLLAGPYGNLPNWRQFDNLILVSSSTGGSFTTPILEDILTAQNPGCVRKITALYVVRRRAQANAYIKQVAKALAAAKELGIDVRVEVATTGGKAGGGGGRSALGRLPRGRNSQERLMARDDEEEEGEALADLARLSTDSLRLEDAELKEHMDLEAELHGDEEDEMVNIDIGPILETEGRPNIEGFVRRAIETSVGRMAVVVCGGTPVEVAVRQSVVATQRTSKLEESSREVFLHVERDES
jgi:NAD(P)H-flavin reductase